MRNQGKLEEAEMLFRKALPAVKFWEKSITEFLSSRFWTILLCAYHLLWGLGIQLLEHELGEIKIYLQEIIVRIKCKRVTQVSLVLRGFLPCNHLIETKRDISTLATVQQRVIIVRCCDGAMSMEPSERQGWASFWLAFS